MSTSSPSSRPRGGISRRCSLDSSCVRKTKLPAVQRRCSFSTISVREYSQTLGDNPSCQEGAPISLGWNYHEQKSVPLDDFEIQRKNQRRSKRSDLILGAAERRKVLVMNGSTIIEILRAERLVALKNGVASMGSQLSSHMNFQGQAKSISRKPPKRALASRAA